MKSIRTLALGALFLSALTLNTHAALTAGQVFCDASHDGQFSTNDTPLQGILVVVTNTAGTFSNATQTTTAEGFFAIELPAVADTYVEYLDPGSLPGDTSFVLPTNGVYNFSLNGATNSNFFGDFLISSSICSNITTIETNSDCCLVACATIGGTRLHPTIRIAGAVIPGCGSTNGETGQLDVVDNSQNLHFQGFVLDSLNCGKQTTGKCAARFLEFQGAGTLVGINGNTNDYGVVYFSARAEDGGNSASQDKIYLRVDSGSGTNLYLISADTANPGNVAPLKITTGSIKIGNDCCGHKGDHDGDDNDDDDDQGKGHHDNGNHGKNNHGKGHDKNDDHGKGKDNNKGGKGKGKN